MNHALDGIRVVDVTHALAAPSATQLLGDLGADVIKVESPNGGDFTREGHPYVFQSFNRNKRSVTIDVKRREGLELIHRLVAGADVFVQSQRPGAVEKMGLGRHDLQAVNPRLIYASLSGFGFTGPDAGRKGVDAVLQAESGLAALQGSVLGNVSVIDESAGLALACAILAALIRRDRTGEVDHVQVNLLDTAVYLQSAPLAEFSVTGRMREQADYSTRFSTVGVFEAADGPIFLAAYFERDWERLCEVFERPDLAKDERFATAELRLANVDAVQAELRAEFATRPRSHWLDVLERSGVMVGVFRSYGDVLAAPQMQANATLESLVISNAEVTFPRPPYRFPAREHVDSRPSPALGSSTDEVLGGLGLKAGDIAVLRAQGILGGAS